MNNKFPVSQSEYRFVHRCPRPIYPSQPQCIEYLEARSMIYNEFQQIMIKRCINFPHIRYVFVTMNTAEDVKIFLQRFPKFKDIYDIIYHTQQMIDAFQCDKYPNTCIVNQNGKIEFRGSADEHFMTQILCRLEIFAKKLVPVTDKDIEHQYIGSSYRLSLALTGLRTPQIQHKAELLRPESSVNFQGKQRIQTHQEVDRHNERQKLQDPSAYYNSKEIFGKQKRSKSASRKQVIFEYQAIEDLIGKGTTMVIGREFQKGVDENTIVFDF